MYILCIVQKKIHDENDIRFFLVIRKNLTRPTFDSRVTRNVTNNEKGNLLLQVIKNCLFHPPIQLERKSDISANQKQNEYIYIYIYLT